VNFVQDKLTDDDWDSK